MRTNRGVVLAVTAFVLGCPDRGRGQPEPVLPASFLPGPSGLAADQPQVPPGGRPPPLPEFRPGLPSFPPRGGGPDVYLADGAETALAIDSANGNIAVGTLNLGWTTTPSMLTTANGNLSWTPRAFPAGSGTYTQFPFDPWAYPGNTPAELFATLIQRDTMPTGNTRTVIGRSITGGTSWTRFYEAASRVGFQDRQMADIDRTTGQGGGPGTTHDNKSFLCFDFYSSAGVYQASYVHVVSPAGALLTEVTVSTAASFNGSQVQPVASTTDGQVYLLGLTNTATPRVGQVRFHLITAGSALTLNRSTMNFNKTGQPLGTSGRYGLNGHRINGHMFLEIDRSDGPRRGNLFLISNRNPNPLTPSLDQGDVVLSVSTNGATTWTTTVLPGQSPGKTQYFSMIDVDDNGWLHVAYYQNETGLTNGGVLNASTANLYYTFSTNGGMNWAPHVRVNANSATLDFEDPPPDRASVNYYLIGDYCQIKMTGRGGNTRGYVLWTGYDKDRGNMFVGDRRERVLCSSVRPCLADFNRDGAVTSQDFFDFLAAFFASAASADFNGDNSVTSQDFFDFLAAFFAGCP